MLIARALRRPALLTLAFLLALVLLPLQALWADVYVFRVTNWPMAIEGYIDTEVGTDGHGAMYIDGQDKFWPLAGFDSWWHGPFTDADGWHQCLVIHPLEPWIVGTITWHGTRGHMDILSTNGEWWEFELTVERVVGGAPDPGGSL